MINPCSFSTIYLKKSHPPTLPRATQKDGTSMGSSAGSSAKNTRSKDHSPTGGPSSTALQVSLTFVRRSQFAALVEHTALHQHFLGMQGCSVYANGSLDWNLRDCDEIEQTSNSSGQTYHNLQNFSSLKKR